MQDMIYFDVILQVAGLLYSFNYAKCTGKYFRKMEEDMQVANNYIGSIFFPIESDRNMRSINNLHIEQQHSIDTISISAEARDLLRTGSKKNVNGAEKGSTEEENDPQYVSLKKIILDKLRDSEELKRKIKEWRERNDYENTTPDVDKKP